MTTEKLDTSSFVNALARLEEGLVEYQADTTRTLLRDGLIQRFEFTYELSHKTLKRYMELTSATPSQYDTMPFQDLIRSANEQGLLMGDWPVWKRYRDLRAKTSHTYDQNIALDVVSGIPAFIQEARHLRDTLRTKLA